MSAPDPDPAKRPLLFPDPVIEFYMAKIDRPALREQLQRTPEERLHWLEEKMKSEQPAEDSSAREEPPPWPARKSKIDMGVDPAWFAEARAVPLLVPDPVIEAYLEDVDRGLIRQALELSVTERFERFHRLMKSAYELRRACAEAPA
ncbi:MAG: hypothetical protein H0X34_10840 [Chthoniobacterales bacterium]|nr:hypothetical protein [Chthoniobacterales bacterium]